MLYVDGDSRLLRGFGLFAFFGVTDSWKMVFQFGREKGSIRARMRCFQYILPGAPLSKRAWGFKLGLGTGKALIPKNIKTVALAGPREFMCS
jgi:hypothetical protein